MNTLTITIEHELDLTEEEQKELSLSLKQQARFLLDAYKGERDGTVQRMKFVGRKLSEL